MSVPWYLMAKGKGGGYKTASGPIVSISDALAAPLRALTLSIDPVQDLHGYDSPWPAGGGVNLLDISIATALNATYGLTKSIDSAGFVHLDGIVDSTGETLNIAVIRAGESQIDALTGKNYVISMTDVSGGTIRSAWGLRDIDNGSIACGVINPGNGTELHMKFRVVVATTKQTTYSPYSNICPISGWTEANVWVKPTYDPTADPTATIQLGQTVYGGTLDVLSGVLTVTHAEVDLGTLDWNKINTTNGHWRFWAYLNTMKLSGQMLSSQYKQISSTEQYLGKQGISRQSSGNDVLAMVSDERYSDKITFKTAMSGVQLVYPLTTPITIPLTPQEISTLAGQNVMWADAGPVDVEYLSAGGANPDLMMLAVAFMGRK